MSTTKSFENIPTLDDDRASCWGVCCSMEYGIDIIHNLLGHFIMRRGNRKPANRVCPVIHQVV